MPRGGGGRSGGGSRGGGGGLGSRSFSSGRPSYSSSKPSTPPTRPPQGYGQPPSLMKQMAATAGGVAAGHLLASAILGSARNNGSIPPEVRCDDNGRACNIPPDDPCSMELKNFVECAYRATEMRDCDAFNTLLKECRRYEEMQRR